MKTYTGKTVEEVVAKAAAEQGIEVDQLMYSVVEEVKGLIKKKAVIDVYDISDVIEYASNYLVEGIKALGFEATVTPSLKDEIIKLRIESERNPILIGKNGVTLQALNELTRLAVSNHFKRRYRILLDIAGYKDEKYSRIISIARRLAHEVTRTKVSATLDPMPADERRAVHNALTGMPHIKTESSGEGRNRKISINYVD